MKRWIQPKHAAALFGVAVLTALLGEAFELLYVGAGASANWVRYGYFALVFLAVCAVFLLLRRENVGGLALGLALFWLFCWLLFYALAFFGASAALEKWFGVPALGDFGWIALRMLHGAILLRALLIPTVLCALVLLVCRLAKKHKRY